MIAWLILGDMQSVCGSLLGWTGYALVLGTCLACLTWLGIRLLADRVRPTLQIVLWAIVLVKFLVPIGPGWSYSLAGVFERLSGRAATELPVAEGIESARPAGTATVTDRAARPTATDAGPPWYWTLLIAGVYLAGVTFVGVARIGSYRAMRRRCLALPQADEQTNEMVVTICRRLGVRARPLVRVAPQASVPFVMGCVRPVLVIPRRYLVWPNELETVIVHEVTHLRRGDMLVRCLQWVAGTVLFFWPVVAWVNRRIDAAREHACDEWALRHGRLTPSEYAQCLLSAAQAAPPRRLAYQPVYMAGNPSTIERRIDMVLALPTRRNRRSRWSVLTIAMLLAWAAFTLTGAVDANNLAKADPPQYQPTKEDMKRHADALYAQVGEHAAGDVDGDGEISKEECWAFVTACVMQRPEAVPMEYPQADINGDEKIDMVEAYDFVRGDADLTRVQKEAQHAVEQALKAGDKAQAKRLKQAAFEQEMMTYHMIFDRRAQFIDNATDEPSIKQVAAIADKMARVDAKRFDKYAKGGLDDAMAELTALQEKAAELRTVAASCSGAEADAYLTKAKELEEKAAKIKAKLGDGLRKKIAQLEADGHTEKAAELRAELTALEDA